MYYGIDARGKCQASLRRLPGDGGNRQTAINAPSEQLARISYRGAR